MLYWHGKGHYQTQYDALWNRLVPTSDEAASLQGELVRSIGRLTNEYYRNGNGNWNRFYRAFTTFLRKHLRDKKVFSEETIQQIEQDIQAIRRYGAHGCGIEEEANGEDAYDRLTDRVVEWCRAKPILISFGKQAENQQQRDTISDVFV